jgi:FlaA1/EpsC-like NDP-sugar epimerase
MAHVVSEVLPSSEILPDAEKAFAVVKLQGVSPDTHSIETLRVTPSFLSANREQSIVLPRSQKDKIRPTLNGFSLEDKVCIVTGGASGIGLEICRAILGSGGKVALVDLNGE